MENEFIRLTVRDENETLYIRPADIFALQWLGNENCTLVAAMRDRQEIHGRVEETPSEIFDMCDKVQVNTCFDATSNSRRQR